jgi:hypothetical protein
MRYPLRTFEIWVGYYHTDQGQRPPTEPKLLAKISAPSFKIACVLYELRRKLKHIELMCEKDMYIGTQDCKWFYDFNTNSNAWTGKYFETKDAALKTFKH